MSWETGSWSDSDPEWERLRKAERRARIQDRIVTAVAIIVWALAAVGAFHSYWSGQAAKTVVLLVLAAVAGAIARWRPSFIKINDEDIPR